MKHHVRTAGRLIGETMKRSGRNYRAVFVTLTYRDGVQWKAHHMTGFIKNVRMWADRLGCKIGYLWVAEMQKRGAVHYHAVIWIPRDLKLPRPDGKRQWWPHGSSNVQSVKRNAVGYLMKYVSKGGKGGIAYPDLPKGARICASGGLDAMASDEFHYWRLPRYVREGCRVGERCRRQVGGGWVNTVTGESFRSEWGLHGIAFEPREADCNGRKRRADSVVMLSDRYKRESAPARWLPVEVVEMLDALRREEDYETIHKTSFVELAVRFGWVN